MIKIKDQLSRSVQLVNNPERIISTVPSITELLFDMGLGDKVVGRTKFCIHPKTKAKPKAVIGGTKTLHLDKIMALKPDLIIANKEENNKEQIETLNKDIPCYISDVKDIESAKKMIRDIGIMTNRIDSAQKHIREVRHIHQEVNNPNLKTIYLIWRKPYMTIGGDTYINDVLKFGQFANLYSSEKRYPTINLSEIKARKPEVIMLSSEPYPFKQEHIDELQSEIPDAKIILVDGEYCSWYGSRMIEGLRYITNLRKQIKL